MTLRKPAVLLIAIAALSLEFPTVAHGSELGISPSQATPAQPTPLATQPRDGSSDLVEFASRENSLDSRAFALFETIPQSPHRSGADVSSHSCWRTSDPELRRSAAKVTSKVEVFSNGRWVTKAVGTKTVYQGCGGGEERTRSHGPPATPDRPATGGGRGPRWISWAGPTIPPGRRAKPRCSAAREAAPPMRRRSRR